MIILPGGSYRNLASNLEGRQYADWFTARGFRAFVLQYASVEWLCAARAAARCAPRHPAGARRARGTTPSTHSALSSSALPQADISAALAGTQFVPGNPDAEDPTERVSSRPDYLVLVYPWIGAITKDTSHLSYCKEFNLMDQCDALAKAYSPDLFVTAQTPPTFWYHTFNDQTVPVEQGLRFYEALVKAGVLGRSARFPQWRPRQRPGQRRSRPRPVAGPARNVAACPGIADERRIGDSAEVGLPHQSNEAGAPGSFPRVRVAVETAEVPGRARLAPVRRGRGAPAPALLRTSASAGRSALLQSSSASPAGSTASSRGDPRAKAIDPGKALPPSADGRQARLDLALLIRAQSELSRHVSSCRLGSMRMAPRPAWPCSGAGAECPGPSRCPQFLLRAIRPARSKKCVSHEMIFLRFRFAVPPQTPLWAAAQEI